MTEKEFGDVMVPALKPLFKLHGQFFSSVSEFVSWLGHACSLTDGDFHRPSTVSSTPLIPR